MFVESFGFVMLAIAIATFALIAFSPMFTSRRGTENRKMELGNKKD